MYFSTKTGFVPQNTAVTTSSLNYQQTFAFTSGFNKTNSDNIQIAAYMRSISNPIVLGSSYFNLTSFVQYGTSVRFTMNVSYSVVQAFCLSVLSVHLTNLQGFAGYNASYVAGIIDSSNQLSTLEAVAGNSF